MSITNEEVKNLANLSRIEVSEDEIVKMTSEIDSILGYVSSVQKFSGDGVREVPKHRNVMRDDVVVNEPGEYKEKILKNAPDKDKDYIIVKKIL